MEHTTPVTVRLGLEGRSAEKAVVPCGPSPTAFAEAVLTHISTSGGLRPETLTQVSEVIRHFGKFLEVSQGITSMDQVGEEAALAFIESRRTRGRPATYAARRIRRTAIRMAFRAGRQLGVVKGDPTIDIGIGPTSHLQVRPLTDEEVELGRSYSLSSVKDARRSIAWALAEATARTSEIGSVLIRDVDPAQSTVELPGSSTIDPRQGHLSNWGATQVRRRLAIARDGRESLIVWRTPPKVPRAASSQAITETLKVAGLHGPDVRPRSIVAWAGRRALKDGATIDEVARLLGMRSLDEVANVVRFTWRAEGQH